MRALASFASSEGGKAFARIEQFYGRDPAAYLEPLDDVLAHNLRAAFMVTMTPKAPDESQDEVRALQERARIKGAEVRRMVGG